jgi:hypothetical protein
VGGACNQGVFLTRLAGKKCLSTHHLPESK